MLEKPTMCCFDFLTHTKDFFPFFSPLLLGRYTGNTCGQRAMTTISAPVWVVRSMPHDSLLSAHAVSLARQPEMPLTGQAARGKTKKRFGDFV